MEEVVDLAEMFERVLSVAGELNATHDLDILLDKILLEARRYTRAEAGSIFLVEGDRLRFCYVQNDAMVLDGPGRNSAYVGAEMPLNRSSLAGYAACTASSLVIDDAYHLPADAPYTFNRSFDEANDYRTVSVLVAPLVTGRGKVVGVLQIINAKQADGKVVPFSKMAQTYVGFYAANAAMAVERATINRELILRTIRMAELRDPKETGAHVNRVAGYAAEIYHGWAEAKGVPERKLHRTRDLIRVAAMLHDVGKVAISDAILKKPGRLDKEEFHQIKYHTVAGARLFRDSLSDLDQMALEIALNHHERWDGCGYPGHIKDIFADQVVLGPGKKAEEIPLAARIVALADVFDALITRRVYKPPWPEQKVLDLIREEAGRQFDPKVVEAFFNCYPAIQAVHQRYIEEP